MGLPSASGDRSAVPAPWGGGVGGRDNFMKPHEQGQGATTISLQLGIWPITPSDGVHYWIKASSSETPASGVLRTQGAGKGGATVSLYLRIRYLAASDASPVSTSKTRTILVGVIGEYVRYEGVCG